mgnify:CR=1 FL=1
MMFKKCLSVLFTCLIFISSARAQLVIEITSGADQLLPIAVVPFGYEGVDALPEDIAQIVEADLARSGLFQPIPRSNMLSMPSKEADVFYRDWRFLKVIMLLLVQ